LHAPGKCSTEDQQTLPEAAMTAANADAIKAIRTELAQQRAAFSLADRLITKLGDELSDAEGQRKQARAHINCLTAQLRDFGVE
jgi:hypothetical protein